MNPKEAITKQEQKLLLELARHSILSTLEKGRRLPTVDTLSPRLREKRGVFVTLWLDGLRGCIGFPYPVEPLAEAVQEASVSAAFHDPRFPPLRAEEMAHVSLEISVLTVPKEIEASKIKVGVHGLIVAKGNRSGLLLPQVAMEYGWDAKTFLEQTCVKAGLPPDAWMGGVKLMAFEAQVFGEEDLRKEKGSS
ncbi:MAG TPA: AmmeMemoRadiSam system protein A [bacterium]|nr:AmmeMemoRadiSam system protein A [bacterium]